MSPRVLPVAVMALLIVAILLAFRPQEESGFAAHGWICLRTGLAIAAIAASGLWLIARRGAILYPGVTGAAAGGLAGLAGMAALEIHCPNLDVFHIVAWHLGTLFAATLIGMGFGRNFFGVSANSHDE